MCKASAAGRSGSSASARTHIQGAPEALRGPGRRHSEPRRSTLLVFAVSMALGPRLTLGQKPYKRRARQCGVRRARAHQPSWGQYAVRPKWPRELTVALPELIRPRLPPPPPPPVAPRAWAVPATGVCGCSTPLFACAARARAHHRQIVHVSLTVPCLLVPANAQCIRGAHWTSSAMLQPPAVQHEIVYEKTTFCHGGAS
jgi:hypothetical protein